MTELPAANETLPPSGSSVMLGADRLLFTHKGHSLESALRLFNGINSAYSC